MHRGPATARGQTRAVPDPRVVTRAGSRLPRPDRRCIHGTRRSAPPAHNPIRYAHPPVVGACCVERGLPPGCREATYSVSLCETLAGTLATYIIIIRMRAACRMPHAACRMRPRARPGVEDAVAMLSPLLTPPQHRGRTSQRVAKGECHVAEPCRRATSATDVSHLTKHSDVPKPRVKLPDAHAAHSCETRNEATRTRRVDAQKEPRAESSLNQ